MFVGHSLKPGAIAPLVFLVICLLSLIGCSQQGSSTTPERTTAPIQSLTTSQIPAFSTTTSSTVKPSAATQQTTSFQGNITRLKTTNVIDQQGTGTEAISMLVPVDWNVTGGVSWILDNPIMPATVSFRVINPQGTEVFELFPSFSLFWTNNQGLLQLFPAGSKYFGSEVSPLVEPGEAFNKFILPRYRGDVTGLKLVNQQVTPDVGQSSSQQNPLKTSIKGGQMRVEYQKAGKSIEDQLYCKVEAVYIPIQGLGGTSTNTNWGVTNICSFSAEKGKLDASSKIFATISQSAKLNPQWFNKFNQVVAYLIKNQIQKIQSAGEFSRILAQTSDQISSEMTASYNEQQVVNDKIAKNFDQYVRGVDSYYDPIGQKEVELPSGYDNAWTNANGEYIVADNSSFNPNIGSNLNWQLLKKQ